MLKAVAVLMLWSAAALADVDSEFPNKALGVEWSATLQQVQAAYPGGTVIPTSEYDEIAYVVIGDFRVLGLNLSAPMLQFIFNRKNTLDRVFWHFKYADRDDVLYGVAEALGQDYSIKYEHRDRAYVWQPGRTSSAHVRIGTTQEFPWTYLGVQAVPPETKTRVQF